MRFLGLFSLLLRGWFHFARIRLRGPISPVQRAHWMHLWFARIAHYIGLEVRIHGSVPARGLIVSNHLGYVDTLSLGSVAPMIYVSKQEVRSWPLFGQLATLAGTVYIDRTVSRDVHRVGSSIQQAFETGVPVVLFAEGTSSDGSSVLPFRPALFESAVSSKEDIWPCYIHYELPDDDPVPGTAATDICYWGDATFFTHILRMIRHRRIRTEIHFATTPLKALDRKQAARDTHAAVLALQDQYRVHDAVSLETQVAPQLDAALRS